MCGFAGILNPAGIGCERTAAALLADMRDQLAHRGPDDAGLWLDPSAGIALGSRRLAISDISPAGHQPMVSANGGYILALNGEIYNAEALRAEMAASGRTVAWRGHSDTEVLTEAIAHWGLQHTLRRSNGMFALALWDRAERRLSLARDRIGKKPLYYNWAGNTFTFGSELKALWRHPGFDTTLDPVALADFLRLGYVIGPRSIFSSACKLPAGSVLTLGPDGTPRTESYWNVKDIALQGLAARASGASVSQDELDALLRDAVRIRMIADVPVGSLLSGGVDSSLITALMAEQTPEPIRTFAVGFGMPELDEVHHARLVADSLGANHSETMISAADVRALVQYLPTIYDEPFADDSMIPTTLLCRAARRDVTVVLSGDGGDELFAGYERYPDAARWLARRRLVPPPLRYLAREVAAHIARPTAGALGWRRIERRLRLLDDLLADDEAEHFNAAIMSRTLDPDGFMAVPARSGNPLLDDAFRLGRATDIDRMMLQDCGSYLVDDILAKVDRASMSTSLEVRCPLLDHRVIEMAWRFQATEKTRDGLGKRPLRALLHRHVPRALVDRPKMGFTAPVDVWLRDSLRDWAESLLSREALGSHGLLNVAACRTMWDDFALRGRAWNPTIWSVLMFQAWHASMLRATATRHMDLSLLSA